MPELDELRLQRVLRGAGALVLLAVILVFGQYWLEVGLAAIAGASLVASRRFPRLTWLLLCALILAAGVDGSFLGGDEFVAYALVAAHALSAGRWDRHWKGLGAPIALVASSELCVIGVHGALGVGTSRVPGVFTFITVGSWLVGRGLREREQLAATLALRIEELDREQEAYARLSVRYERARIAADLHDLVAHAISVMVIQAGAGQRLAASDPEQAHAAFRAIAGAAREAEDDLGRLLELLSDREAVDSTDLALVEELVSRSAASGLDVRLQLEGDTEALPPGLVELAHRVVQEGITNALRYATGAPVRVLVRGDAEALLVEVANGPGAGAHALAGAGTGNGLRGLKERADSCGGTIQAGPAPDGGWRLVARAPRRDPVLSA